MGSDRRLIGELRAAMAENAETVLEPAAMGPACPSGFSGPPVAR
ncbi:hypothetical protein [Nonomuraea sp. 3-1Str]|nr:hypothetical protein [Nonomuraea sp. 3-1Str]